MHIIYRNENKIEELKYSKSVKFLYNTFLGRMILKIMTNRFISKIGACFFNSRLSIFMKNKVIKEKNIDMNKFVNIKYDSYNKFFIRKYIDEYLNVDKTKNVFISPCDSKLMILKINENDTFKIKNSHYQLTDIIDNTIISNYKNGYLLIFRLDVNDYHRYCYVDYGIRDEYHYIDGILHTVQPIVYDKYKVFHRNAREWCLLKTNNFDDIIQVEVGALMVGKIVNDKNKVSFSKVQERLHIKNKNKILSLSKNSPAIFIVFDILYKNKDLTNLELLRRKKILSKYQDNDYFVKTKFIEEKGVNFFKNIKKMKLEGMVAKLKEGKYYINKRTNNFIKIKNLKREEFLIGGYEYKKNDILSISLGEYIENKFHFVGKVSINKNKQIYNKLLNSKKSKNYFFDYDQNITYIKPVLKCNIEYLERTKNNHLRHPIYKE